MKGYSCSQILEYTNNLHTDHRLGRHGFSYRHPRETCLMNKNTPKQPYYEIVRHRRGLLLYDHVKKKYVPNRRGRPKHFPLPKHVQQYLQKRGVA